MVSTSLLLLDWRNNWNFEKQVSSEKITMDDQASTKRNDCQKNEEYLQKATASGGKADLRRIERGQPWKKRIVTKTTDYINPPSPLALSILSCGSSFSLTDPSPFFECYVVRCMYTVYPLQMAIAAFLRRPYSTCTNGYLDAKSLTSLDVKLCKLGTRT